MGPCLRLALRKSPRQDATRLAPASTRTLPEIAFASKWVARMFQPAVVQMSFWSGLTTPLRRSGVPTVLCPAPQPNFQTCPRQWEWVSGAPMLTMTPRRLFTSAAEDLYLIEKAVTLWT